MENVIIFNFAIFLFLWLIARKKQTQINFTGAKELLVSLLRNKLILFSFSAILGFGVVKILINLVNPPFGWDDLNYHFTFPVEWLKHANLNNPITVSDDPSPSYYPINGSLLFLWLMFPFKSAFLSDLAQVPFFIAAFLAVYSIGRKLGLRREDSFLAASLFTLIPNYFKQMRIAYVDVMVAALFLVCVVYLFLLNQDLSGKNALIYSMSLGLLLGTKTAALPYTFLLFLPFIFLSLKNTDRFYLLFISALIIIVLGGFAYIRNLADTGNPLYPLDITLFGKNIFRGALEGNVYRAHFKPQDYSLSKLLFHEGLGVQTLILILPALFLALPLAWIKRKKIPDFSLTYFLILPLLIYLAYRYVSPYANTRYLYPLLGIGMTTAFYSISILKPTGRIIGALIFICVVSSLPELARRQELTASFITTSLLFFLLAVFITHINSIRIIKNKYFISLLVILGFLGLVLAQKYYVKNEYQRYIRMVKYSGFWPDAVRAWDWLNSNTQGNNIAYIGRPVPFPLYGTNFKNNVYYVSVNKTDPAKLHYFPHSRYVWGYDFSSLHKSLEEKGNYRSGADYAVWLSNILARSTDYLFVYSLHQTRDIEFPLEDSWARSNPKRFQCVFTNETIHIYKIIK